jgi:hypothetical protein
VDSFFETPEGRLVQHRRRERRRILIYLDDVEPQSKKMVDADKDAFQRKVLKELKDLRRAAFVGPLALSVHLSTTRATAPQAHTIAKNLLDLLGSRRPSVRGSRKHILYKDDSQVHGLSVSCAHGETQPRIAIEARPFATLLDDLELSAEALREIEENDPGRRYRADREEDAISSFKRLVQNETENRRRLGDQLYEAMVKMERWYAQRALLARSRLNTAHLCWLMGRPKGDVMDPLHDTWDSVIRGTALRVNVGELPSTPGSSAEFKRRIDAELTTFKRQWEWLISPLVVPAGLEVVVRPSPTTPKAVLHDLDNIVRDYLLPQIVPKFGTVTDHRFTVDFEELKRVDPGLAARWAAEPGPPKGTRDGISRYEAWRLPPAPARKKGFVSVALVADTEPYGDLFQQIDDQIKQWADLVQSESNSARSGRR